MPSCYNIRGSTAAHFKQKIEYAATRWVTIMGSYIHFLHLYQHLAVDRRTASEKVGTTCRNWFPGTGLPSREQQAGHPLAGRDSPCVGGFFRENALVALKTVQLKLRGASPVRPEIELNFYLLYDSGG
jgi:hypothetical protein